MDIVSIFRNDARRKNTAILLNNEGEKAAGGPKNHAAIWIFVGLAVAMMMAAAMMYASSSS